MGSEMCIRDRCMLWCSAVYYDLHVHVPVIAVVAVAWLGSVVVVVAVGTL